MTSIGYCCFSGCSSLTNIQLPSSLLNIEEKAFYETNIKSVNIPKGVTKFKCKVPEFIKNILESKEIKCPSSNHDEEDTRRETYETNI